MKRLIVFAALVCLAAASVTLAASSARKTSGTVWASANHQEGQDLYVSGDFKDKILGRGALVYVVRPAATDDGSVRITARKVTLYTTRGTLQGTGEATQTFNPDGTASISDGRFRLSRGTDQLAGHKLSGRFTGTFSDGIFILKYTGTYR